MRERLRLLMKLEDRVVAQRIYLVVKPALDDPLGPHLFGGWGALVTSLTADYADFTDRDLGEIRVIREIRHSESAEE